MCIANGVNLKDFAFGIGVGIYRIPTIVIQIAQRQRTYYYQLNYAARNKALHSLSLFSVSVQCQRIA